MTIFDFLNCFISSGCGEVEINGALAGIVIVLELELLLSMTST